MQGFLEERGTQVEYDCLTLGHQLSCVITIGNMWENGSNDDISTRVMGIESLNGQPISRMQ